MSKRKRPTCVSDDPDYTEAELIRGTCEDVTESPGVITRFRCNACGLLIDMECANVPSLCPVCYERPLGPSKAQARAARWKAEAKRLRKVLVKIANTVPKAVRHACGLVDAEALMSRRKP